jgi:ech hydrogenase subunit A
MLVTMLIVLPLFFAFIVLLPSVKTRNVLTIAFVMILAGLSVTIATSFSDGTQIIIPHAMHNLFILIDAIVLLYFLYEGVIKKHSLVIIFAVIQIVLYAVVLYLPTTLGSYDIFVDTLTSTMYLVINIVGGLIIIYALEYIQSEAFSVFKKNAFIALLFFFLAVMNFIVSANNIEIFFLLFELTTLCSFILISYRQDKTSINNALSALWVNQMGGVAILVALIMSITHYNTLYFDKLLLHIESFYMLPLLLLAVAALIKGASIPFDKWLLGAMVAPTPVSAILHSATMVKIAPYLIIRLSESMNEFVSLGITLLGSFVFFSASLLALSKDYLKEILGLSTIALLALMMSLAAIGTPEAVDAALLLIVFHAISKALLFLQVGILEKLFNLKYVSNINNLINDAPLVVFFIIVGFASLSLPPFAAFVGKLIAFELVIEKIVDNPLYVFSLIFMALGSVFLTLLYFKLLTKLLAKDSDKKRTKVIEISKFYTVPSFILVVLLMVGIYINYDMKLLSDLEIMIPLLLIVLLFIAFFKLLFKNAHRVKEYHCGEKDEVVLSMYYFELPSFWEKMIKFITLIAIVFLFIGVLS